MSTFAIGCYIVTGWAFMSVNAFILLACDRRK